MARFGLLTLAIAFAGIMGATTLSSAGDDAACRTTKFETKLVKDACASGGQKAAKDAMKGFLKEAKKKKSNATCQTCHKNLAPKYELKPDAVKQFKEFGGV